MRKRTLGVVLLAGLAMSGAGAFTASNTFTNTSNVAGYGQNTVTGATVSAVSYSQSTSDSAKISAVKFQVNEDITTKTSTLTLRSGTNGVTKVSGPYNCTPGVYLIAAVTVGSVTTPAGTPLTCTVDPEAAIDSFTSTGLTVTQ